MPSQQGARLLDILIEDMKVARLPGKNWLGVIRYGLARPMFSVIVLFRLSQACRSWNNKIGNILSSLLVRFSILESACHIDPRAGIGAGLYLPHPTGIVIGPCSIGRHVTIFQNVTIGARRNDYEDPPFSEFPVIGSNVQIYAGAVIIGPIKVGDYVEIGANAVVTQDVPPHHLAVGVPAQIRPISR